jgi:hypothetical protein
MKIEAAVPAVYEAGRSAYRRQAEKSGNCSSLDNDVRRPRAAPMLNANIRRAHSPSHNGTEAFRQTHHGGMEPQFVAQVLGQILKTGNADPVLVRRAYATASAEPAPVRLIGFL